MKRIRKRSENEILVLINRIYYSLKTVLPRPWILGLRRRYVSWIRSRHSGSWPIAPHSANPPRNWAGWPDGKQFALVLTHDVESSWGLERCLELAALEERHGFRSSFNFVSGDYAVPESLRNELTSRGFEVGIHGLHHRNNPFRSKTRFMKQAREINRCMREWGCAGFRSPSMFHDLDLLHHLDIEYDASTFDTDPFEPQPDGMRTIFPFWVPGSGGRKGYVELPYTLPQDFLLYVLMRKKSIDIWEKKLAWIADHGGMALVITHPDYMDLKGPSRPDEYPVRYYEEFLSHIRSKYDGRYWHVLPRDMAGFWKAGYAAEGGVPRRPLRICMPVYSFYEMDNRVMRYAEALEKRGDQVEIVGLGREGTPRIERIRGVELRRIQKRDYSKKGRFSYLLRLMSFFFKSLFRITAEHLKDPYDLIHVHSVPDFEVFAAIIPKLTGAKVILDIHDIVPEFYASKFHKNEKSWTFKALAWVERLSCGFSDFVIVSNHIWEDTLLSRSVGKDRCAVIMNYPDDTVFFPRPRVRDDGKFIIIYPGTLAQHQGLDIAIKAFDLIKDQAPHSEFHIYGRGQELGNILKLVEDLGLAERVFVRDTVPLDQVASLMADADLGVIPKRDDPFGGEAFSTKILEFMTLNVPVIVSRTKIDQHYFNESIVKFFRPSDVEDLALCMMAMIGNRDMREELARNARRFVEAYSWKNNRAGYFGLVDSLASPRKSREKGRRAS